MMGLLEAPCISRIVLHSHNVNISICHNVWHIMSRTFHVRTKCRGRRRRIMGRGRILPPIRSAHRILPPVCASYTASGLRIAPIMSRRGRLWGYRRRLWGYRRQADCA